MSHEANLFCKTCNESDQDTNFRYQDTCLIDFLKAYVKWLRDLEAIKDGDFLCNPYIHSLVIAYYTGLLQFVFTHRKHELCVRGEYAGDEDILICEVIK